MTTSWFRVIVRLLSMAAVIAACLGSFITGYYVGYTEACHGIAAQDRFTFEAVQEYLKNHPGR